MHVLYIKNYRKKLFWTFLICLLWAASMLLTGLFFNNSLIFKVTINRYLSFSYPIRFEVSNIYINQQYDNSIETNAIFSRPITQKFKSFTTPDGKISFNYPSAFDIKQQQLPGTEILYHIDFRNKENTLRGFVQVWNLSYPLKEFLDKAKSTSQQQYKYFNTQEVTVNELPGYYWDYVVVTNDGKSIKGSEVFLQKDDKMFRVSYFVPAEQWNKEQSEIFWNMVNSLKTY